jgi:hypothetical protein
MILPEKGEYNIQIAVGGFITFVPIYGNMIRFICFHYAEYSDIY